MRFSAVRVIILFAGFAEKNAAVLADICHNKYQFYSVEFEKIATTGKTLLEQTYTCCTNFRKDFYTEGYVFTFPESAMEACSCKPKKLIET